MSERKSFISSKIIGGIAVAIVGLTVALSNVGYNDAGYRTVVQDGFGNVSVKMSPGPYIAFFHTATKYPDYLTYDFSPADNSCDFEQNDGITVRYQDGGEGIVCGMANAQLPTDEETMVALHKRYRSSDGVRVKLLNQSFPKALNLTAGLMSSEEAYATKRSEYIRMAKDQAINGLYKTVLKEDTIEVVGADGKITKQSRSIPVIVTNNNVPVTQGSDFTRFGITISQFDLKSWDFEERTITQIQDKRKAEMAIVTAKANANKAHYEKQQVIADGEKSVATAEYEAKVLAEKQIQEANRDKALALIKASQVKEKATEMKLAAIETTAQKTEEFKAAQIEADIIKELADAESYKIDKIQEAGKMFRAFENSEIIAKEYAGAIKTMKVPSNMTIVAGSGGSKAEGDNGGVAQLTQLQMLRALKALTPAQTKNSTN